MDLRQGGTPLTGYGDDYVGRDRLIMHQHLTGYGDDYVVRDRHTPDESHSAGVVAFGLLPDDSRVWSSAGLTDLVISSAHLSIGLGLLHH